MFGRHAKGSRHCVRYESVSRAPPVVARWMCCADRMDVRRIAEGQAREQNQGRGETWELARDRSEEGGERKDERPTGGLGVRGGEGRGR